MYRFMARSSRAAATKPITGEISRDKPTSTALAQLTPETLHRVIRLFASPTPRIEPISECELDTGRPYNQVARFQVTPASNNETTITMARTDALSINRSTGSRLTMLNAT